MTYAGLVTKLSTSGSAEIFVKMKMYAVILVACLAIYVAAQEGKLQKQTIYLQIHFKNNHYVLMFNDFILLWNYV